MKKNKILPAIKKDIKYFLFSEEAKVSKKNIAKVSLGLTMLGLMFHPDAAQGHDSSFLNDAGRGKHSSHGSHGSHTSHASHGSHTSHGSHGSHGSHSAHNSHASHVSHESHASHVSYACSGYASY